MPRLHVTEKLTLSEHDPISKKFIGENHPLDSSGWPSGVSNQSSHHEWESERQKGGANEALYKVSHLPFNVLLIWVTVFPSTISPHCPHFSCYFILLQLTALSFQLVSLPFIPIFSNQQNIFLSFSQHPLGISLKRKAQTFLYFIPNWNKVKTPQCLRMRAQIFSLKETVFHFLPSSKITGVRTQMAVKSSGLCLSPSRKHFPKHGCTPLVLLETVLGRA